MGYKNCVVKGCTNRVTYKEDPSTLGRNAGITYHRFPKKNAELLAKWIAAVQRKNFQPSQSSRVCSEHFRPEDMDNSGMRRRLRPLAVPSFFPDWDSTKDVRRGTSKSRIRTSKRERKPNRKYEGYTSFQQEKSADFQQEKSAETGESNKFELQCAALGCDSQMGQGSAEDPTLPDEDITLHRFPVANLELLKKWHTALGRKRFRATPAHRLCNLHFTRKDFHTTKQGRWLRYKAVPSIFQFPPPHLLDQVNTSAPYLQPRIKLRRVDEPEPEPAPEPEPMPGNQAKQRKKLTPEEIQERSVQAVGMDHCYPKETPEEEIARLKALMEEIKDRVMSTSQKVKCLKISVSALKRQYELETQGCFGEAKREM